MTCHTTQERMSAMLAGAASGRERLDIESHAQRCAGCSTALQDYVAASVALERAYAPLRARATRLSPARVRLAMRIPEPVPASARFSRITARITEFGLAAAVTAFAFVGGASVAPQQTIDDAVTSGAVSPTHITSGGDDQYVFRWLRLGRYAPQADTLDPAISPSIDRDDAINKLTKPERVGLVR